MPKSPKPIYSSYAGFRALENSSTFNHFANTNLNFF